MVLMVFLKDQKGTNKRSRATAFQAQLLPFCIQSCQRVNFEEALNLRKWGRNSLKSR